MILETADGVNWVISLFNVSLISLVDIVVEWILEWESVSIIGSLDLNGNGTDDGLVWSPWTGNKSGGVEESWSDDVGLEVLLNSAFFHIPAYNLDGRVWFVSDLNLMESVVGPVVSLFDISGVEIVVNVVVITEVVGGVDMCGSH